MPSGRYGKTAAVPSRCGKTRRRAQKKAPFRFSEAERWNPKFLAACAAILALLILIPILIASVVHRHTDEPLESKTIQSFYSAASGKTSLVFSGQTYEKAIMGKIASVSVSADGLREAVLTEEGELYYVTTSRLESVATRVQSFVLSTDGTKLAYVVENEPAPNPSASESETETTEKEEETTKAPRLADENTTEQTTEYVPSGGEQYLTYLDTSLFLYFGADGSKPKIADHVSPASVCMSPNGTNIGYAVTAEDGKTFEGFLFNGETTESIGRNAMLLAMSDDALQQYYLKFEQQDDAWVHKLFSKAGETEIRLGEFTDGKRFSAFVNRTCSEIVFGFSGKDGAFFHCKAGNEKIKLANGFSPVLPRGTRIVSNGRASIVPLDTFAKSTFIRADGTAQYIDAKTNCLDTGARGKLFRLTPDGKTLYYLNENGSLGVCVVRKADKKELASGIMNFDLSPNGRILYYVNTDNDLHIRSGSKDRVAEENVYAPGEGMCVTDSGYLYFLKDYTYGSGTLCYLKDGGKVRVQADINDVHDICADTGDYIYYRGHYTTITGTYDLYYGKQKKYTMLFKDMG